MSAKRRRLMFSCVPCRNRKLKCGREHPQCARCIKAGRLDDCQYIDYKDGNGDGDAPNVAASQSPPRSRRSSTVLSWVNEIEEVARVSTIVPTSAHNADTTSSRQARQDHTTLPRPSAPRRPSYNSPPDSHNRPNGEPETVSPTPHWSQRQSYVLKGTGFRTRYFGPSHYTSIFINCKELALYMRDTQRRCLPTLQKVKTLRLELKTISKNSFRSSLLEDLTSDVILKVFPDQVSTDRMIAYYLSTFETTYRVLHVPSFQTQYKAYLEDPSAVPVSFLLTLLLIMAMIIYVEDDTKTKFVGSGSVEQHQAREWIDLCNKWSQAQSLKHTTIANYQIKILLWLAMRMSTSKTKRGWLQAGDLVRTGILTGLHREPSAASRKIPVFEQEMRRRLWATIVELEAIACLDQGIRPSITTDDWDTRPPSNIDDEDLQPNCKTLPRSKPLTHFTKSSFLCICSNTIGLRLSLISTINKIKPSMSPEEIYQHNIDLRKCLIELPSWHKSSVDRVTSKFAHSILQIQIYEIILLLHQPSATSERSFRGLSSSVAAFREAAIAQLEIQQSLPDQDSILLFCLRTHIPRATLCLCYEIIQASAQNSSASDMMFNQAMATQLIEHTVKIQTRKCIKTGMDMQPLFMLSCALSLMRELAQRKAGIPIDQGRNQQEALARAFDVKQMVIDNQIDRLGPTQNHYSITSRLKPFETGIPGRDLFMLTPSTSALTDILQDPPDVADNFDFDFGAPMFWDMEDYWSAQQLETIDAFPQMMLYP